MGGYTGSCACHCVSCCIHVGQEMAPHAPPPLVLSVEEFAEHQRCYGIEAS